MFLYNTLTILFKINFVKLIRNNQHSINYDLNLYYYTFVKFAKLIGS